MKNKSKILLSIFLFGILAISVMFFSDNWKVEKIQAGDGDNVFGWAWSENIGWISFNNTSGEGGINYGVNIDQITGLFSGYAWSRGTDDDIGGVGWISFADFDGDGDIDAADKNIPGSPCTPNCEARLDLGTHKVTGWARALAPVGDLQAGGWDGWIKLNGSNYGVEVNDVTHEFEGWAWGGDDSDSTAVIGWIGFNHLNCDSNGDGVSDQGNYSQCPIGQAVADYKVETSFVFNNPPQVGSPEVKYQEYCGGLTGQGRIGFKWIYEDEDSDNQIRFDFRVNDINNVNDDDVNFEVNRIVKPLDNPIGTTNNQLVFIESPLKPDKITFNKTYYWWARVWDSKGGNSGWVAGPSTTTDVHAWPYPDFDPSPQNPSVDQVVEFVDISECYDAGGNQYLCRERGVSQGGVVRYEWDFDYDGENFTVDSTYEGNATTTYPTSEAYTVRLQVTDDRGTCGTNRTINVTLPLPEWEEVAP